MCGRGPNDIMIDVKVGVNKPITGTDDRLPRDLWMGSAKLWIDPTGRLPDDLQRANKCESKLGVRGKIGLRSRPHKAHALARGFEHVQDSVTIRIKQHIESTRFAPLRP